MEKGRFDFLDVAKGLGMLIIVFMHSANTSPSIFFYVIQLFFFLSGLSYKYNRDKINFWKKKIIRIYIPYIVCSIISIGLFYLFGAMVAKQKGVEFSDGIGVYLFGMVFANSRNKLMKWNTALWFLPCLFIEYLIVDVTEEINKRSGKIRIVSIVLSVIITWCIFTFHQSLKLPFAAEVAIAEYAFFELGILFKNQILKKNNDFKDKKICWIFVIILMVVALVINNYNGFASLRIMKFGKNFLLCYFVSICWITAILFTSFLISENTFLKEIGQNTMMILLLHKFPILFFQTILPITKTCLKSDNIYVRYQCQAIVTIIVIVICLIVGKTIGKGRLKIIESKKLSR